MTRIGDAVELETHALRNGVMRDRCRQTIAGCVDQPRLVDLEVGRVEHDLRNGLDHVDGDDRLTAECRRRQIRSEGQLVAPRDDGARQSVLVLLGHGGPAYLGRWKAMTSTALGSAPVTDPAADVAAALDVAAVDPLDVAPLDVVGIGNALVDVLTHGDDAFLQRHHLVKASMTLIDTERSNELYEAMGPGIEQSGGSAGNTIAGIASFGGSCGYIGKIADDQLGDVFAHDLHAAGVTFDCPKAHLGVPTGRCLIVVTPDGQRTMSTYLGVCELLGPDDVDADLVAQREGHLSRGLSVGQARGDGRVPQGRRDRPRRRTSGLAHAV